MRHCCGRDRTLSIRLRPPSCCLSLRTSITGLGARTTRTKRRLGLPKFDAILVGVDGLAGSKAALDWVVSEAQLFSLCAGTGSPSPKRREFWQCRPQQLEHGTNVLEKFRTPNLKWTSSRTAATGTLHNGVALNLPWAPASMTSPLTAQSRSPLSTGKSRLPRRDKSRRRAQYGIPICDRSVVSLL